MFPPSFGFSVSGSTIASLAFWVETEVDDCSQSFENNEVGVQISVCDCDNETVLPTILPGDESALSTPSVVGVPLLLFKSFSNNLPNTTGELSELVLPPLFLFKPRFFPSTFFSFSRPSGSVGVPGRELESLIAPLNWGDEILLPFRGESVFLMASIWFTKAFCHFFTSFFALRAKSTFWVFFRSRFIVLPILVFWWEKRKKKELRIALVTYTNTSKATLNTITKFQSPILYINPCACW